MNVRQARALRPTAMAIVAERKIFAREWRRAIHWGDVSDLLDGLPTLPPPTTPMRAMVRADRGQYARRVVQPVLREESRAAAFRPWWLP